VSEPKPVDTRIRALLANRRYARFLVARFAIIIAMQMLSVAVGWQVYAITGQALALGFSGLAIFLPAFVFAMPGGHVADRHDRRTIMAVCNVGVAVAAASLAVVAYLGIHRLWPIYAILSCFGLIRAFNAPAGSSMVPSLIEKEQLERAIALGSSSWQLAMIAGPSLGGAIYAATGSAAFVYALCSTLALMSAISIAGIGPVRAQRSTASQPARPVGSSVLDGLRFVWSDKPILGSISLDLFAVLLGGAVALLPMFARDILRIGPWGLGLLRSAPGIGAASTALLLAWFPLKRRAGITMFALVFVFGVATIVFGVSKSFALSLVALLVVGAADMFSVVVRSSLVLMRTPDEMRGRVSAVNMLFIGASNELGEFESGVTAAWLGPELAVVVGGIGTCVVVLVWAFLFPGLRSVDRLQPDE
jgi:MFS family permease